LAAAKDGRARAAPAAASGGKNSKGGRGKRASAAAAAAAAAGDEAGGTDGEDDEAGHDSDGAVGGNTTAIRVHAQILKRILLVRRLTTQVSTTTRASTHSDPAAADPAHPALLLLRTSRVSSRASKSSRNSNRAAAREAARDTHGDEDRDRDHSAEDPGGALSTCADADARSLPAALSESLAGGGGTPAGGGTSGGWAAAVASSGWGGSGGGLAGSGNQMGPLDAPPRGGQPKNHRPGERGRTLGGARGCVDAGREAEREQRGVERGRHCFGTRRRRASASSARGPR
jgi:hypothetical protein